MTARNPGPAVTTTVNSTVQTATVGATTAGQPQQGGIWQIPATGIAGDGIADQTWGSIATPSSAALSNRTATFIDPSGNRWIVNASQTGLVQQSVATSLSPSGDATGAVDQASIQTALNAGGSIVLQGPGTFYWKGPFTISDDSRFYVSPGVVLQQAANNGGQHLMNNSQWQSLGWAASSQITSTGTTIVGSSRYTVFSVTLTAAAIADLATAKWVQIIGDANGLLNGIWQIFSASGTTLKFLFQANSYSMTSLSSQTTLASPVTAGATTISLTSSSGFPGSGTYTLWVDQEKMQVTAGQGTTTLTVTRGWDHSTAVAHGSGAPVSTLGMAKANANIEITIDGFVDYNEQNGNSGASNTEQQLILLNRVRNFRNNGMRGRGNKAMLVMSNTFSSTCRNWDCDTGSDGVHYLGTTYDASVDNLTGNYGDDPIAWVGDESTIVGNPAGIYFPDAFGDLHGLNVRKARINSNASRLLLLASYSASSQTAYGVKLSDISCQNMFGPMVACDFCVVNDIEIDGLMGTLTTAATLGGPQTHVNVGYTNPSTVRSMVIRNLREAPNSAGVTYGVNMLSGSSIVKLTLAECDCVMNTQLNNSPSLVIMNGSASITELNFVACQTTDNGTQNFAYKWLTTNSSSCTVGKVNVLGGSIDGYGSIEDNQYSASVDYSITGLRANARWIMGGRGQYTVGFRDITLLSGYAGGNSMMFLSEGNSGGTIKFSIHNLNAYAANKILNSINGQVLMAYFCDATAPIDITKITRQAGAMVVHNGGTTAGTIVANNMCVCDATNAANSWKQVSNTANTY